MPSVLSERNRTVKDANGQNQNRVIKQVLDENGTFHVSCEVFSHSGRIADGGATHLYSETREESDQQYAAAQEWLKGESGRLLPQHREAAKKKAE